MTLVVDASVVVAALTDAGEVGRWADQLLADDDLAAPHLMLVEAANILRRLQLSEQVSRDLAGAAYADLMQMRVALFPYMQHHERAWALRDNLTMYDASYVSLAESLDAPLATLDLRLKRATGPVCSFCTPPDLSAG